MLSKKIKTSIIFLAWSVGSAFLLFLLVEGFASTLFVVSDVLTTQTLAEQRHTQYDPELGWRNIANLYLENIYGPKIYVKINSQGFRNTHEFTIPVPNEKIRVICSGDSFTFGYGVDNEHAWCQLLSALNPRLEAVNMGQGGYGIDQAYLWYKRDGVQFDHHLHLFAFVTDDFGRAESAEFAGGYNKPTLAFQHNALVTQHVPVPQASAFKRWLAQHREALQEFNVLKLLHALRMPKSGMASPKPPDATQIRQLALEIFKATQRLNQAKNSTLVLVYLPSAADYLPENSQATVAWQQFLHAAAAQNGLLLIDLVEDFRKLSYREALNLFILPGTIDYAYAAWHYNNAGNAYIANLLARKLQTIPEIAAYFR